MQLPTSIPPATSDGTGTDPTRRYRCRHVFTDGHRCGSPSLRQQELCYYHHASRRGPSGGRGHFLMPRIDDRPAIQIAIYDILARIALGELELKTAGMLLYGLQIAASNLSQHEKALRHAAANPEPLVEDVVSNPFLGDLAPIEEIPDPVPETTAPQQPSTVVILSEGRSPQSKDPEESHIASVGRTILPQSSASPNQQPATQNQQQPATCFSPRIQPQNKSSRLSVEPSHWMACRQRDAPSMAGRVGDSSNGNP